MPIAKLRLKPGVDVQETPTLNAAQISTSTLIRFYAGLPQKRAGWQEMTSTALIGTCSGLHGWADIEGNPYLAAGTEQRLEVLIGGTLFDITPTVHTSDIAVSFTTTATDTAVTIDDATYNPAVGDWVDIVTQVSVGGIVLYGDYIVTDAPSGTSYTIQSATAATSSVAAGGAVPLYTTTNGSPIVTVTLADHGYADGDTFTAAVTTTVATVVIFGPYEVTVVDTDNFTITAGSNANADATGSENGGDARILYLLPSGFAVDTPTTGYGLGDYGADDYGLGSSGQITVPARQWSLDNFGADLIASPSGGKIYYWVPPDGSTRAAVVDASAPIYNTASFVMSQARIVVALGSEASGVFEPLLIRWLDIGDFTTWTATSTNQAGSYIIPQGSRLVGGIPTGLGALLWTDIGLYSMNYVNLPDVFAFNPLATGCGLIGLRAVATTGSLVMWLSNHGFFLMTLGGSGPIAIECPVWDIMFNNWDLSQPSLFVMGANTLANEFELFWPIASTSPYYVADSVTRGSVKYNFVEKVWDYSITSQLQRTAWQGHWVSNGGLTGNPVGADTAGLLQQHEVGYDANGDAMSWAWQTGYFDIAEGEDIIFLDWLIPDFVWVNNPTISLTVMVQSYPNVAAQSFGPFEVSQTTAFVPPFGARGRQMAIQVSGSDLGTFNRLGGVRYRYAPDGRGI